jgi:hypothetical protein
MLSKGEIWKIANIGNTMKSQSVHPSEEVDANWKGGPHISFRTGFPKPGLYKVWGQFQHKGKVIMANFILEVA